jgi:nicotinamide phosphoribosyltransferase
MNSKGYHVLDPHIRPICGDGLNIQSISKLVHRIMEEGFAIDNIAFGMGGGLLQQVNRDTLRFAMKANALKDAIGVWHDVSKAPATDHTKGSKAGRRAVILENGKLVSARLEQMGDFEDQLLPVWRDAELLVRHDLGQIRQRSGG